VIFSLVLLAKFTSAPFLQNALHAIIMQWKICCYAENPNKSCILRCLRSTDDDQCTLRSFHTTTRSVESMIDDFLGSWVFYFRTESRGERDAWIQALDQQIVGMSTVNYAAPRSCKIRKY
jgi:hypothetical protein